MNIQNDMTKQEIVASALEALGYKPQKDNDGDLLIRYEMKSFYVMGTLSEDNFLSVIFPQFYEFEEREVTKVLAACNKLTRDIKLAKVYIDQTFKNVTASCEFFYNDEENMNVCLEKSLEILGLVRSGFVKTIRTFGE